MQEAGEVVIEEGDEFEVYYDEEFDAERARQLEQQLANEKGGLSTYWAGFYIIIIINI